jgi:uncharacterized protein (DUF1778 family)
MPALAAAQLIPQSLARLEARISVDLHSMIKRAAQIQGRTLTDYVTGVLHEATQQVIERAEVVRMSIADQRCFAEALLAPPKPNAALKRAFANRSKLLAAA